MPVLEVVYPCLLALVGVAKELVLEQFGHRLSPHAVFFQAAVDEVLELGGPLARDPRYRLVEHRIEERVNASARGEGWLACCQFVGEYAESPHVDFLRVGLLLDDFGRNPLQSTKSCPSECLFLVQEDREAKVSNLDLTIEAAENVLRLDISMQYVLLVHFIEAESHHVDRILAEVFGVLGSLLSDNWHQ